MSQPQYRAPQAQVQTQTRAPTQAERDAETLEQVLKRTTEYVPFMADEPIRLSPGMVIEYLCVPTKSGKICDHKQAVKFVMLNKARKLNPWEGDSYLIGYDTKDGPKFNLVTAHQAFLKRAEVHKEFNGMESGVIVHRRERGAEAEQVKTILLEGDYFEPGDVVVGGWATVFFKTRAHAMHKRLRLATFKLPYGRWEKDEAGMIVKCAEADALRSSFPSSLGGMYLSEELDRDQQQQGADAEEPPLGRHRLDRPAASMPTPAFDAGPLMSTYQTDAPAPEEASDPSLPDEPGEGMFPEREPAPGPYGNGL